jgi:hypothetical protein
MATPQQIFTDAYAKSKKNQPGRIATESVELLGVVNRVIRTFFQIGVRVNPTFFGDSAPITFAAGGWARPTAAEMIYRIEETIGSAEVVVVPFDQKTAESGLPAVYRLGQVFYSAGNAGDPTSGDLTFFYAKTPTDVAAVDDPIDSMWPETYKELAVLEVAAYLAVKDGRESEVAYLVGERDNWLRMFLAFLEHETVNERRSYGMPVPFNTGSMVPIASLLSGGSGVTL